VVFCMQISSIMKKNEISLCKLPRGWENEWKNIKIKIIRCLGVLNIVSIVNGCIPLCGGQVIVWIYTYPLGDQ